MAGRQLTEGQAFIVYSRPRLWFSLALFSGICFVIGGFIIVAFARVSPSELLDAPVLLVIGALAIAGTGFGYFAWRNVRAKNIILSADELGVWVGLWGKRQTWDEIAHIRFRNAIGDPIGLDKFIAFEPPLTNETPLGKWIEPSLRGRMVDTRAMRLDKSALIKGLERTALSAGYTLTPEPGANPQMWTVRQQQEKPFPE